MDVEVCSLLFKVDPLVQIYECCSVFLEGSEAELEVFFRDLHSLDSRISFTKDSLSTTANYLDVTISLEQDEVDDSSLVPQFQPNSKVFPPITARYIPWLINYAPPSFNSAGSRTRDMYY